MKNGSRDSAQVLLVLHAHLPYVRHPELDFSAEELWLYEAVVEVYLPLLEMLEAHEADGVQAPFTLSLSTTLLSMLHDPLLQERCAHRLGRLITVCERESQAAATPPLERALLESYARRWTRLLAAYDAMQRNLCAAFLRQAQRGGMELICSTASHAYLPLLAGDQASMRAQIHTAVQEHARVFGERPAGIWLPECGYVRGLDRLLQEAGLRYFFVDTHALLYAEMRPQRGIYAPVFTPRGVAVFAREPRCSQRVWSAETGYPGDDVYREFHRDAGYDWPLQRLGACAHPSGYRLPVGIKLHRVTGREVALGDKQIYQEAPARARAREHAKDLCARMQEQVTELAELMPGAVTLTCPFDAELFGHWWYEGPVFLDRFLRRVAAKTSLQMRTPSQVLGDEATLQCLEPLDSSWGAGGFNEVWLNERNAWIYPRLQRAARQMRELTRATEKPRAVEDRALKQMARELLLAQASDWPFILHAGTQSRYARQRIEQHLQRFASLRAAVLAGAIDAELLQQIESADPIYPEVDHRVYR